MEISFREPPTLVKQQVNSITCGCESSAPFLAHLAFRLCELLSSLFVRRSSVNISHFNLPRNHWANCIQTLVEWSLDGPLPKLCPVIPIFLWNFSFSRYIPIMQIGHIFIKYHFKSSPLKPLNQIIPILAGMVPGWVPLKVVSDSPALHSRWLLLLKIKISSIVHCCFSISQNELKF
jgi:hypothetical protein